MGVLTLIVEKIFQRRKWRHLMELLWAKGIVLSCFDLPLLNSLLAIIAKYGRTINQ